MHPRVRRQQVPGQGLDLRRALAPEEEHGGEGVLGHAQLRPDACARRPSALGVEARVQDHARDEGDAFGGQADLAGLEGGVRRAHDHPVDPRLDPEVRGQVGEIGEQDEEGHARVGLAEGVADHAVEVRDHRDHRQPGACDWR